jgi:hypothetical protein
MVSPIFARVPRRKLTIVNDAAVRSVRPGVQVCSLDPQAPLPRSPVNIPEVSMLPNTPERVPRHTDPEVNRRISEAAAASVRHHASHPERIDGRLRELDAEWDIERTLEANAATLALAGTVLGAFSDRRFLVLPAAVAAFLLQHAFARLVPASARPAPARGAYAARDRRGTVRAEGVARGLRPDRSRPRERRHEGEPRTASGPAVTRRREQASERIAVGGPRSRQTAAPAPPLSFTGIVR